MRTRYLCLLSALILFLAPATGQTKADIRDLFNQGETFILFEEYNDALQFYLDLNKLFPDNANYKYRIGQCYINMPGEKGKAIPYLEDAVKNISLKHKIGRLKEKTAPYDALYYLANAYRINNQLDRAIDTYESFMQNMDQKIYDSAVVHFQLQTCHNAIKMMQTPLYVKDRNLGEDINDRYSETNPVVAYGGKGIFFTRVLPFRRALFFSEYSGDRWSGPIDIIPQLNVDDKFYPTSVSPDGKTLYLYSDFDYIGNLYVSRLVDDQWTPVEKLNDNINTKYWESHATISPDGRKLYFSSNRKGGLGGLDIYVSELDSVGSWGPAKNLGPVINTGYHEDTPFLTEDGKTMFFSSRGHYNMGGFDIFYTTLLDDGTWSAPLNAGYPLNTTDDDLFFMPVGSGYEGYIARFDEEGYGLQDIYRVEIFSDDHPRRFLIRGITRIQDLRADLAESIRIIVRDLNDPDAVVVVYSDPQTGRYEFEVKHGDYEVTFNADGTMKEVKRITLPLDHPGDTVAIVLTQLEKADFEAILRVLSDSLIRVQTGDSLEIRLFTEPKSVLNVLAMNEGNVIASDRFMTADTAFSYRFLPKPGINIIDFKLTDMFSNIATARVVVEWQKEEPVRTVVRPEYTRLVADRQVAAFLEMLKQNADDDLKKVISLIDPRKQKFGTIDDVIAHIRELAADKGIKTERVDKLALKTAVKNNILTQAVVDYLGRNASGELRDILQDINVYDLKLRSWSDLKEYVTARSEGRITGDDLDRLANWLLTGPDPEIAIIREKIGIYARTSGKSSQIGVAVTATDNRYIISAGEWLETYHNYSLVGGFTEAELSLLYSVIGFPPATEPAEAISQMMKHAPADLKRYLEGLDPRKMKMKDARGLVDRLLASRNRDFEERNLFSALARTIAENNLSEEDITAPHKGKPAILKVLLPLIGLLLLLIIILFYRRKKRKDKENPG